MTTFAPTSLVRRALLADAVVSGITGAMLTFTAPLAAQLFGLPDALLRTAGLFCVVFGAAMVWLSRMPALSHDGAVHGSSARSCAGFFD